MLIDTGCFVYKIISFKFIRKTGLEYIIIFIKKLIGIGEKEGRINKIIKVKIDIDGHLQDIFFYMIQDYLEYNLILDKLQINHYNVKIAPKTNILFIYLFWIRIINNERKKQKLLKFFEIKVIVY